MEQTINDTRAAYLRLLAESLQTVKRRQDVMQRMAKTIDTAHQYRLYLLDAVDRISAAESFSVAGDRAASEVAAYIFDSCSDTFKGYELWQGAHRIARGIAMPAIPEREAKIREHQDTIADLEERLQRGFACVNRSQRLFEAAVRLKQADTASLALTPNSDFSDIIC